MKIKTGRVKRLESAKAKEVAQKCRKATTETEKSPNPTTTQHKFNRDRDSLLLQPLVQPKTTLVHFAKQMLQDQNRPSAAAVLLLYSL